VGQGETKKMRIRLSEDEVYEIKMPEEIGMPEFLAIISKFNFLAKSFAKFGGDENASNEITLTEKQHKMTKKHDKEKWIFLRDNKQAVIEILKAHYIGTYEDFINSVRKYNIDIVKSDISSNRFKALRELHKITPNEVGLTGFPTRDVQVKYLLLKENKK